MLAKEPSSLVPSARVFEKIVKMYRQSRIMFDSRQEYIGYHYIDTISLLVIILMDKIMEK